MFPLRDATGLRNAYQMDEEQLPAGVFDIHPTFHRYCALDPDTDPMIGQLDFDTPIYIPCNNTWNSRYCKN